MRLESEEKRKAVSHKDFVPADTRSKLAFEDTFGSKVSAHARASMYARTQTYCWVLCLHFLGAGRVIVTRTWWATAAHTWTEHGE